MIDLSTLMLTVFYAAFGILLMVVSNIVIDLFIPGNFAAEIRRGNRAVVPRHGRVRPRDGARQMDDVRIVFDASLHIVLLS